jgi:hypothetical protein
MDLKRLKSAFDRLELLDDRLTYKIRPRSGSLNRASLEQLEEKHRLLAEYTTELKDILRDVILAAATRPAAAKKPE